MVNTFDELGRLLNLKTPTSEQDLDALIAWCKSNLSTDIDFKSNLQERFDSYEDLAKGFLENIKPNIQRDNLTAPVPFFENKTSLRYIVELGLDVYLKNLKPSAEQINSKTNGISLLLLSAVQGNIHTSQTLLSLGANPLENNAILEATLRLPISHDDQLIKKKQAIYLLLSPYFAELWSIRNESGDTILHIMAIYGYDELINNLLLQSQTKELAYIANNFQHYPIHAAILNRQTRCAQLLAQVEGTAQLSDAKKRNALHYAARYGDREMVKICLKCCPIESLDIRNQTPLILASIAHNLAAVRELLNAGAEINARDKENKSALHYAVESNNIKIVQELLNSQGIDANSTDSYSQNPLDLVKQNTPEGAQISQLLKQHGAECN